MTQQESPRKLYLEIVKQLRTMIEKDGLKAGDKIPSERELSERLNAGRSSVREALRALELLGLIETRRGEGTFIRDFRGNQLVQLLSTFILQDEKAKKDVIETKYLIEIDCLQTVLDKSDKGQIGRLKQWAIEHTYEDGEFFSRIAEFADNHLIFRIWEILKDYYHSLDLHDYQPTKQQYIDLAEALEKGDFELVLASYRKLRNLSA
ncbi:GntR family transcriptional regulator [Mesobacillus foraminis]|jgi:DNA-binding FadR family transcriptional regulator|uniref:DNA-binding FadR family transcriptional regulator n=2 Tax=Mesobacillus foraminis TaxID=279826 RepID=A0A4R2BC11_9BACI|nr:GntR family transcriptional regulator [Mesobacillus foraminis]MBT2754468.1 FadR family transcriptional regulator [Mesobacillus foraminis]TCN24451.1 DNA-binding FadR family transcriptional regulator [Mesobacillus foraminis]